MKKQAYLKISVYTFLLTGILLTFVQLKVESPMLLLERFVKGGGWIEIVFISFYAALVSYKMQNPSESAKWRIRTWQIFTYVFFAQLLLGIMGFEKFLMTGKLHLPVPAMILAGPIYRYQLSFMTILFISTIVISGPVWCSHLCYFGAMDGIASSRKRSAKALSNIMAYKHIILLLVVVAAILFRYFRFEPLIPTIVGGCFGLIGLLLIVIKSTQKGKMLHCVAYCPIGTLVHYLKYLNPFRLIIGSNCTQCMACSAVCKYDALNAHNIQNLKPAITCTLCGDCLSSCKHNSLKYQFFSLSHTKSRNLYLVLSISLHAIFLALGRI